MIVVAATDNTDALAYFSDYGAATVDLGAPGVNILSTLPGATYGYMSGTSMATPCVSGAAALMLSACQQLNTPSLKAGLLGAVDQLPSLAGMTSTGGRLNVSHALAGCSGPVNLTPVALNFNGVLFGASSPSKTLTLTNNQSSALNISAIQINGDFSQTNNCPAALAPSATCAITVIFSPTNSGVRTGQIQVFDNASNSPQSASLLGTGTLDIDLIAATYVSPTQIWPSGSISVTSTITNQGTAGAPASVAAVYLSQSGLKDSTAVALASVNTPALGPGASYQTQFRHHPLDSHSRPLLHTHLCR